MLLSLTPLFAHGITVSMNRNAWLLMLAALALAGQACNLQRILDPSLPTSIPQSSPTTTSSPTPVSTPVPTLTNEARVEAGDLAFFYGDWEGALDEYQRVLTEGQDEELRAAARAYSHASSAVRTSPPDWLKIAAAGGGVVPVIQPTAESASINTNAMPAATRNR